MIGKSMWKIRIGVADMKISRTTYTVFSMCLVLLMFVIRNSGKEYKTKSYKNYLCIYK